MSALKREIIECARAYEADLVGFGSADRFVDSEAMKIFPGTRTVIAMAFRVLRGVYRGIEEGTTYYQYCTNGVEVMEEVVMPRALLRVCACLEDAGFAAYPQRRQQTVMPEAHGHNVEMDYEEIYHGLHTEAGMDFVDAAVSCGLGERGLHGALLTRAFGPMQRIVCVLTDAELAPDPIAEQTLCDGCGDCAAACPGHAIAGDGTLNPWQCGPYYRGASRVKNPFMPKDAFDGLENREQLMRGTAKLDEAASIRAMSGCIFYPPIKQGYAASVCGRACDMACYKHLEAQGKIDKKYAQPFRRRPEWKLDPDGE